jgi:hypothetical protein
MRPATQRRLRVPGTPRRSDSLLELEQALGPDHPLARVHRAAIQTQAHAATCTATAAAAPALALLNPRLCEATAAASTVLGALLWTLVAMLRHLRRERVHDLLMSAPPPPVEPVLSELRRLSNPCLHTQLAHSLERALDDGERWHEMLPTSRPPHGARNLPANASTLRAIAAGLRAPDVPPRAVVMTERLMCGGYGSGLYNCEPEWLARELGRIRFELAHAQSHGNPAL